MQSLSLISSMPPENSYMPNSDGTPSYKARANTAPTSEFPIKHWNKVYKLEPLAFMN